MIFLKDIFLNLPKGKEKEGFPFNLPALWGLKGIRFDSNVTFFVGENGSGKSTLLEAIAKYAGFNLSGGARRHVYEGDQTDSPLARHLRLSWTRKTADGFFLRAESFFNFASYLDEIPTASIHGGKSFHHRSHGEAFLHLFTEVFEQGLYILDEPEAALSPVSQLAMLRVMKQIEYDSQFIIATHSPLLLSYPGATIWDFDSSPASPVDYDHVDHVMIYRRFMADPEGMLKELFKE